MPAGHDYVRHAISPAAGLTVLDDPVLDPAEPARWWPHPTLEAAERPDVLDGADLVHVHFGYEHRTPDQIADFVAALRSRAMPLVVTVHDLTNPHEPDPAAHLERTGHLVRGADAVITLTEGAAAEIRERWGVDAQVIPHPRLMPTEVTEPLRLTRLTRSTRRMVGLALGSLRAGVAVDELVAPLVAALPDDTRLTVMVRSDALSAARDPEHPRHAAAVELDRLDAHPDVEVRAHEHLTDAELCAVLAGFDALVLPHRHGTHSGWLELCRDLGVPPVVPRIGYLAEQWATGAALGNSAVHAPAPALYNPALYNPALDDPAAIAKDLRRALVSALDGPPVTPRSPEAEDGSVAGAHLELYRRAVSAAATR
ncbi:glycosyltransferase [Dietzia sp. ANT_WB102]|uniref:glycosyltransferase n=1 Tax=Dietzia sp. ANT_WB102 TaxID=2597345 RepID=UPI0011ECA5A5|nr:glycosyltransferase [Dietzia sp. ANT_WB102]KAA0918488.1 glycosyltransferase family 4 protein [Dietzia sp. ANT_WB102]